MHHPSQLIYTVRVTFLPQLTTEANAVAFDVDHYAVAPSWSIDAGGGQQPIQNGRYQHRIVEDLSPVSERLVGVEDRAGLLATQRECSW